MNDYGDKMHIKFIKYLLGVNKKTSNLAVLSETGRFPVYFSIILSMIEYLHRLETLKDGLLYDAFICNKELHFNKVQTWYTSATFLLEKMDINLSNTKIGTVISSVKKRLISNYLNYWRKEKNRYKNYESGKLDTFFKLKDSFRKEKYLDISEFKIRQAISKIMR